MRKHLFLVGALAFALAALVWLAWPRSRPADRASRDQRAGSIPTLRA
jgi:hypothetical protein